MCSRHSFILDRNAVVYDGFGITDSHSTIRELASLGSNDSGTYAFDWQPRPPGHRHRHPARVTIKFVPVPEENLRKVD